jgi:AraC-like DNA-binding protein
VRQRRSRPQEDEPRRLQASRHPSSTTLARAFEYYPPLKRVDEYVSLHLNDRISLRLIADIAHLEPKYFSAFFRAKVGLTFTEWLAARRIERAAAMLQDQDYSIAQVAEGVGLRSCRTCERWFRRLMDMTPQQFKQSVKPN